MSSVIVAGATGAIGREFVVKAVEADHFTRVVALTRSNITREAWADRFPGIDIDKANSKLHVQAIDWEQMCAYFMVSASSGHPPSTVEGKAISDQEHTVSDDKFPYRDTFSKHQFAAMCMGTTRSDAGGAEQFRRCDVDYVDAFAKAVKRYSPELCRYSQVSSSGANSNSLFLYMKTKGESDMKSFGNGFRNMSVFRPGLLDRNNKTRFVEKIGRIFMTTMPVKVVARAMINDMVIDRTIDGKLANIGAPLISGDKCSSSCESVDWAKDGELLPNMAMVYSNNDIRQIAEMQ
eukprot:Tbor_TRINITY_DN4241_c0_g1::TRINITY_DN4241_c0_g1_i1::g.23870::m.23870/K17290/HTATIP2; oxidoreductase